MAYVYVGETIMTNIPGCIDHAVLAVLVSLEFGTVSSFDPNLYEKQRMIDSMVSDLYEDFFFHQFLFIYLTEIFGTRIRNL